MRAGKMRGGRERGGFDKKGGKHAWETGLGAEKARENEDKKKNRENAAAGFSFISL